MQIPGYERLNHKPSKSPETMCDNHLPFSAFHQSGTSTRGLAPNLRRRAAISLVINVQRLPRSSAVCPPEESVSVKYRVFRRARRTWAHIRCVSGMFPEVPLQLQNVLGWARGSVRSRSFVTTYGDMDSTRSRLASTRVRDSGLTGKLP